MTENNLPVTAAVITSINIPNDGMRRLAEFAGDSNANLIVIGDAKSIDHWTDFRCDFLSLDSQLNLNWKLSRSLPINSYSRKNIGYLQAFSKSTGWIYETDDDNFPISSPFLGRDLYLDCETFSCDSDWLNIYHIFHTSSSRDHALWPRGFDLGSILESSQYISNGLSQIASPIQQGLANNHPDVDALYRLLIGRDVEFENRLPVSLLSNQWCPTNSQSTWWHKDFFELMYLPSTCTFRLTDILRGYIATRLLRERNYFITYHSPLVKQVRNPHNLMIDFRDELQLYENADRIVRGLESLELRSQPSLVAMMRTCYTYFVELELVSEGELELLELWVSDCNTCRSSS